MAEIVCKGGPLGGSVFDAIDGVAPMYSRFPVLNVLYVPNGEQEDGKHVLVEAPDGDAQYRQYLAQFPDLDKSDE